MPRKSEIPEREKQIGRRLRGYRESLLLTRTAFALKLGLSSGNLHKYENGWVPLPWAVGDLICVREQLSQRWLATGELPKAPYLFFEESLVSIIPRRALFSDAYRDFLSPRLTALEESYRKEFKSSAKDKKKWSAGFVGWFDGDNWRRALLLPLLQYEIEAWFKTLSDEKRFEFLGHMESSLRSYLESQKHGLSGVDIDGQSVKIIAEFFERERLKGK